MYSLTELFEEAYRQQAPYTTYSLAPIALKFWICARCLAMAPAIGLQTECPPTDWQVYSLNPEEVKELKIKDGSHLEGAYYTKLFWMYCPKCKEQEDE
jgi:hypothetical protein